MHEKTFNTRIQKIEEMPTPRELKAELPLSDKAAEIVLNSREEIKNIIHKKDKRLLAIVGPCSIHDTELALDYAQKLQKLRKEVESEIAIVMRVYFEKPRTTVGWQGLINDPYLNGTYDVITGIQIARKLLVQITEMGLACTTEILEPVMPQYTSDLISWAAIGARTTESQTHRNMASGLSMPVGFKNGTNGDIQIAINAIKSCEHPQSFLGVNQDQGRVSVFHTRGNPDSHIVLRGGSNGPNFGEAHIKLAEKQMAKANVEAGIIIDCSHANSSKDHEKQALVLANIVDQKLAGNESIVGFMLESNINAGKQPIPEDLSKLEYGVSITDACIDWETTESIIKDAAKALREAKTKVLN